MFNSLFQHARYCLYIFICATWRNKECKIMRKDSNKATHNYNNHLVSTRKLIWLIHAAHFFVRPALESRKVSLPLFHVASVIGFHCLCDNENRTLSCLQWRASAHIQAAHASTHETTCRDTYALCSQRTIPTAAQTELTQTNTHSSLTKKAPSKQCQVKRY